MIEAFDPLFPLVILRGGVASQCFSWFPLSMLGRHEEEVSFLMAPTQKASRDI